MTAMFFAVVILEFPHGLCSRTLSAAGLAMRASGPAEAISCCLSSISLSYANRREIANYFVGGTSI